MRALSATRGAVIIGGRWTGILSLASRKKNKPPRDKRDLYRDIGYQDDAMKVSKALLSSLKEFCFEDGEEMSLVKVEGVGKKNTVADLQEAQHIGGWIVAMDREW
jgi:hypothetical protein